LFFLLSLSSASRNGQSTLASATTFEQFRDGVFQACINYVTNKGLRALRRLRVHTMANANDRMADEVSAAYRIEVFERLAR
jgi:hypothetical protein